MVSASKKEERCDPDNYRLVHLTIIVSMASEQILEEIIIKGMMINGKLDKLLHKFTKGKTHPTNPAFFFLR